MNLQVIQQQACLLWRDHVALIDGDFQFRYGELFALAERAAAAMIRRTSNDRPRVAVLLSNRWEYVVLDMACAHAGITLVRMNARDGAREAAYILQDSAADCFIYSSDFAAIAQSTLAQIGDRAIVRVELGAVADAGRRATFDRLFGDDAMAAPRLDPETIYKLMYTSGTTGVPKGVIVTHDQWCCAVLQNLFLAPLADVTPDDCFLHVTPLTHVSGGLFWAFMMRGAQQVICPGTTVDAIAGEVTRCGVTRTFLVPTLVSKMVSATPDQQAILRGIKRVYYAASPIGPRTLRAAVDLYGPIFAQGYGSTEAMWWLTFFYPEEHAAALRDGNIERLASCGRPSLGLELKIVGEDGRSMPPGEIGEVATRGRHVAKAYLTRGAVPRDAAIGDGWFRLGDMGYADADGFFYLVDRKSSMIITGGFNVYPSEVEAVLLGCNGVAECCVIGAPDEHWGELIVVFVVPKSGASVSDEDVLQFGRTALADYKRPRRVVFVDELPMNSGGKVDRRALREAMWANEQRRI
jgi:acyl-CoA synthetase (AMP-forming)/AMP-acid ligase II